MSLWEEKLACFSIIQIKNQIMKKYFKVLQSNWQKKALKVRVLKTAIKNKKRRILNELRKYGRSRANCKEAYKYVYR